MNKELAYGRMRDDSIVAITKETNMYVVACFGRNDIEQWRREYEHEGEAWQEFRKAVVVQSIVTTS